MTDDLSLEQRVHALIYDADPEIPAAAVIALVRAAVADEIEAAKVDLDASDDTSFDQGYNIGLTIAARIADPSRAKEQK